MGCWRNKRACNVPTAGAESDPGTAEPNAERPTSNAELESEKTRDGVNEEGEDNGVKAEREHAVEQSQTPQFARGYLHVGDLAGHSDNKSKVSEIEIIRPMLPRKLQSTGMSILAGFIAVTVKNVRVMQTENRVDEHPGESDGAEGEDQMRGEMRLRAGLVCAEQKTDREQSDRCRDNDKN